MVNDIDILKRGVKNRVWTEPHRSPFGHRITVSGYARYSRGKNYIEMEIMIDQHIIKVYTHKDFRRGYLHYFHYIDEEEKDLKYDLYLPVDEVLNGQEFFTTTKMERRVLKLKQLKEKLEKRLKKV